MKLKQLLNLYPQASVQQQPQNSDTYLSIKVDNQWLILPKKGLSSTEIQLLQIFSNTSDIPQSLNQRKHPWADFLLEDGSLPTTNEKKVRFIQAFVTVDDNREEWANSFKTIFSSSNVCDSFWLTPQKYILVEQISNENYSQKDFAGIAETLDINLNTKTKFFVGNYWETTDQLVSIFNEELKITDYAVTKSNETAVSISQVAIDYWLNNYIKKSHLFSNYKKQLHLSDQMIKVITTLYDECGNISSAAKKLYIHRNTLQYQIEKFQHQTGLNLKNMNDLVFCYFLTV